MAFLIEEKRCTSPTSSAQVNAVIGPTAGMVINRSTRSIGNESRSSDSTMALSVFCKRTTQAIGDETYQLAGRKSGGCPRHVKRAVRHTDVDRRRRNLEIDEKLVALRRRTVKKNTVRGQ